jgi:hypothetical protein
VSALTKKQIDAIVREPGYTDPKTGRFVAKPKTPPMRVVIKGGWGWRELPYGEKPESGKP